MPQAKGEAGTKCRGGRGWGAAECLQKLTMEGDQRKGSEMVRAEAAEVGGALQGTCRGPNFILWINHQVVRSQPYQHLVYMKESDSNNLFTRRFFDKRGIRTRNISSTLQAFFLP